MGIALRAGRPEGWRPGDPRADWSYLGFGEFRRRLARQLGFELGDMVGFGGEQPWDAVTSPLRHLLDHSDCDGELTPKQAVELAPALVAALGRFDPDDFVQSYDLEHGRALVKLLGLCAAEGIPVQFC